MLVCIMGDGIQLVNIRAPVYRLQSLLQDTPHTSSISSVLDSVDAPVSAPFIAATGRLHLSATSKLIVYGMLLSGLPCMDL